MNMFKRTIAYLLIACLVITCIPPLEAGAASSEKAENAVVDVYAAEDDGILLREYSDFAGKNGKAGVMAINSSQLTHNDKFKYKYDVENGIDISRHNGKVDWNKVKADGVDFALIRMAYRGYGDEGTIKTDDRAIENLKGALAAGLDVGVYFFSQAITKAEAIEEANYILDIVKGYDFDLPVVMDFEYTAKSEDGRLWKEKQEGMTDRQRTNVCLAFCKTVEAAGYDAMVYANREMLETDVFADEIDAKYEIWLAEWSKKATYENDYTYWQYTSDGSVNGVSSDRVDLNVRYVYSPFRIKNFTYKSVTMEWAPVDDAEGYVIYRKPDGGTYEITAWVEGQNKLSYVDTSVASNTKYSYYVRYYKTDENGEKQIYKTGYPYKSVRTNLKKLTVKGSAVNAGSVKVSWNKEANGDGYIVQRYNASTGKYVKVKTVSSPGTLAFTDTGLKIGTTYKYRVRAYASVNGVTKYSTYSDPVSIKTASTLKKPVVTAKPYSYTTNKLSWKRIPGATGYVVQRYDKAKSKWVTVKTIKSGSTLNYSNTYLDCSTTYKYRVKATAALAGKTVSSYYSDTVSAKTKSSRVGVVKDGPLNVRKGPGTSYGKLTKVDKGKSLTVTGSTKSWYKIRIKVSGKYRTGYVSKEYVKLK